MPGVVQYTTLSVCGTRRAIEVEGKPQFLGNIAEFTACDVIGGVQTQKGGDETVVIAILCEFELCRL